VTTNSTNPDASNACPCRLFVELTAGVKTWVMAAASAASLKTVPVALALR
jgi:hypothetical protein